MASASNSCAREKLAIVSFDLASASAPAFGSLSTSLTTWATTAACLACSSRIAAWRAMTWPISCASTEASSASSLASAISPRVT